MRNKKVDNEKLDTDVVNIQMLIDDHEEFARVQKLKIIKQNKAIGKSKENISYLYITSKAEHSLLTVFIFNKKKKEEKMLEQLTCCQVMCDLTGARFDTHSEPSRFPEQDKLSIKGCAEALIAQYLGLDKKAATDSVEHKGKTK